MADTSNRAVANLGLLFEGYTKRGYPHANVDVGAFFVDDKLVVRLVVQSEDGETVFSSERSFKVDRLIKNPESRKAT